MNTRRKSEAISAIEKVRGGPLYFGAMIRSIRECDEISQSELSKKAGVSLKRLAEIENGHNFASVEEAMKLANAMGYSAKQFITNALDTQLENLGLDLTVMLKEAV